MNRLRKLRDLLGDTRERWFFFPLDWHRRRQKPWINRSRFWHRAAARRVARRIMRRNCEVLLHSRDNTLVSIHPQELAAYVLRKIGDYDVRPRDVLDAHQIPSLVDRFIDRFIYRTRGG